MAYYNVCPDCDSNLDPGEKCDCKKEQKPEECEKDLILRGGEVFGGYLTTVGRALPRNGDRAVRVG